MTRRAFPPHWYIVASDAPALNFFQTMVRQASVIVGEVASSTACRVWYASSTMKGRDQVVEGIVRAMREVVAEHKAAHDEKGGGV